MLFRSDGTKLKSQYISVQDFGATNDFVFGFNTNAGTQVGYLGVTSSANNLTMTSSNSLVFAASSSEGMRLTSTGLGIGTSSPAGKLDVYQSSSRYIRAYPSSGLADLEIVTNNNVQPVFAVKGTGTADLIRAYSGATQVLTLDSSGNLGIGTSSPSLLFQVEIGRAHV